MKKHYQKGVIKEVKLVPEEAVLFSCKNGFSRGPVIGAFVACNSPAGPCEVPGS